MKCENCGKIIKSKINFCPYCGSEILRNGENYNLQKSHTDVYYNSEKYPLGSLKDNYDYLRHFRLNFSTIICVVIEWLVAYFAIILLSVIPILGILITHFPFQFSVMGYNKFFGPLTLVLLLIFELLRQSSLIEYDIKNAKLKDVYSASNYHANSDVLSKETYDLNGKKYLPDFNNIKDINLGGSESEYLEENEAPCWYRNKIALYAIHEWKEDPVYVTTGTSNVFVTSDWSDPELHKDWEKIAVGELWVTNKHVVFYAQEDTKQNRNLICITFDSIYFVQGHFDLKDTFNCVRLRVSGAKPIDFIFHSVNDNREVEYDSDWNGAFVNAINFGMIVNQMSGNTLGIPAGNNI
ncbi:zinc ribbon domain-containing protein [Lactiplantibacillus plantarum]|nr:zinc ribbon domain-containing protein [Lactiplantibacillus plantarum]AUS72287.1 hypothetical protein C1T23_01595 [Lactiplantibacillus plantarum]MBO2714294.1 zinc-ribbon domain-containing protein [Lactiplantibacillus plantarum]PTM29434.1 zinc ribbon domain-containing protein [Lactiplantibacillus plantarum]RHF54219.1 zinc ribbon domain-containing protein [Lactiplantibacillus plantarum]USZ12021.1 zinc ribbon domain-containing protein [Lactiplantibacillus plantarum]